VKSAALLTKLPISRHRVTRSRSPPQASPRWGGRLIAQMRAARWPSSTPGRHRAFLCRSLTQLGQLARDVDLRPAHYVRYVVRPRWCHPRQDDAKVLEPCLYLLGHDGFRPHFLSTTVRASAHDGCTPFSKREEDSPVSAKKRAGGRWDAGHEDSQERHCPPANLRPSPHPTGSRNTA
jgi:hypothetical protein